MSENAPNAVSSDEIDLFAYLEILWCHRRFLALLVFSAVAVAAVLSWWVIPPTYEAVSLVQVGQNEPVNSPEAQRSALLGSPEAYRSILLSAPVLTQASRAAGIEFQKLEDSVRAELVPNTNVVKLAVQAGSPEQARAIGAAWYEAFRAALQEMWVTHLERQLSVQRARLEGMRQTLDALLQAKGEAGGLSGFSRQILVAGDVVAAAGELNRLEQMKEQIARGELDDAVVVAPFHAEEEPVKPRKALNLAIAGFLALMVGIFGTFAAEGWRTYRSLAG
ncbi:MAG: Wzz/FepE/Etk N-terminal domain-containing protein [Betaproteobacteria bacterium]